MKKLIAILTVALCLTFSACSHNVFPVGQHGVVDFTYTLYDNEVYATLNGTYMSYYSLNEDILIPLCNMPNCTHNADTSPDCSAYCKNNVYALNKIGNKVYFFEPNDELTGMALYSCDKNGGNRQLIATDEKAFLSLGSQYFYIDNYLFYSCSIWGEIDEYGEYHETEKYTAYINKIDLENGAIETLVEFKDYSSIFTSFTVYENKLIYTYKNASERLNSEQDLNERFSKTYYGIYSLDLESKETFKLSEGYDRMSMLPESGNDFNPKKIICYNTDEEKIYFYNMSTGKFTPFVKCTNISGNFTANSEYLVYKSDIENDYYDFYNLKTEETVKAPQKENYYLEAIIGDTLWLTFSNTDKPDDDGNPSLWLCSMSLEDFLAGNYENITQCFNTNSGDEGR